MVHQRSANDATQSTMLTSRVIAPLFIACVLNVGLANGQDRPSSLWDHNESVVALFANGDARIFRYEKPRDQMRQEGVGKGTVLFSGTTNGDTYEGTAYIFHRNCDPIPYAVSGTVSDDSRRVTLNGSAPSALDSNCQPTAYRDDVLQFRFIRAFTSVEASSEPAGRATEKYIREQICGPIIHQALSTASRKEAEALQRSLVPFCERCFAQQFAKTFSREKLASLDLFWPEPPTRSTRKPSTKLVRRTTECSTRAPRSSPQRCMKHCAPRWK